MEKILAAIDYSVASINAAKYAASIALAFKAELVLFNVYHLPFNSSETHATIPLISVEENAEIMLNEVKEELLIQTHNKIKISISTDDGSFSEKLNNLCKRIKPCLVVIGTRCITELQRMVFGGNNNKIINYFEWPLYKVPVNNLYNTVRRIGLSSDFENEICLVLVDECSFTVPGKRKPHRNIRNLVLSKDRASGIVCQSFFSLKKSVQKLQHLNEEAIPEVY